MKMYFRFKSINGEILEIQAMSNITKTRLFQSNVKFYDDSKSERQRNWYDITELSNTSSEDKVCETYLIQCSFRRNNCPNHLIDLL